MKQRLLALAAAVGTMCGCASAVSAPTSAQSAATLASLTPASGSVGSSVTLTGSGFAASGNTVKFGAGFIKNLSSPDGRTLRFTVPSTLDECPPASLGLGVPCPDTQRAVVPGVYAITLVGSGAPSAELMFTVRQD